MILPNSKILFFQSYGVLVKARRQFLFHFSALLNYNKVNLEQRILEKRVGSYCFPFIVCIVIPSISFDYDLKRCVLFSFI